MSNDIFEAKGKEIIRSLAQAGFPCVASSSGEVLERASGITFGTKLEGDFNVILKVNKVPDFTTLRVFPWDLGNEPSPSARNVSVVIRLPKTKGPLVGTEETKFIPDIREYMAHFADELKFDVKTFMETELVDKYPFSKYKREAQIGLEFKKVIPKTFHLSGGSSGYYKLTNVIYDLAVKAPSNCYPECFFPNLFRVPDIISRIECANNENELAKALLMPLSRVYMDSVGLSHDHEGLLVHAFAHSVSGKPPLNIAEVDYKILDPIVVSHFKRSKYGRIEE